MAGIELERVQRLTGGRVHLAPGVPETGDAVTLCGQRLRAGAYRTAEAEVDCRTCLRRRDDPGRISSAFFESDAGTELLERSLQEARARRDRGPAPAAGALPAAAGPAPMSTPPPPSPAPPAPPGRPVIPELRSGTPLRRAFERVWVSPEGVVIRTADGSAQHVTFNGPADVRRRGGRLTIHLGDVTLEFELRR